MPTFTNQTLNKSGSLPKDRVFFSTSKTKQHKRRPTRRCVDIVDHGRPRCTPFLWRTPLGQRNPFAMQPSSMASRSTSLMPRHHPSRRLLGRGSPGRLEAGPNKGSFCILYACVIWFVQPIESTCPTILADALGRWDIVTCLRIDMFAIDLDRLIDIKLVGAI